jgi:hypothetical protein
MPTAIIGNMPYAEPHFIGYAICQLHICIFNLVSKISRLYCIIFENLSPPVAFLARRKGRPAGKGSAGPKLRLQLAIKACMVAVCRAAPKSQ